MEEDETPGHLALAGILISICAAQTKNYEDRFLSPFVAAERGYIDEVILPRNTRWRIARALNMLANKTMENPWKKHDNIPL